jgi:hypothetical protein
MNARKRKFHLPWLLLLAAVTGCTSVQRFADRLTGFYRRGSCISIDIPPITLTPSQTAGERQLIGREITIEENGWIIPGSAGDFREEAQGDATQRARRLYQERGILDFFEQTLRELRTAGVLGEGFDGNVHYVPDSVYTKSGKYRDPYEIQNARRVADEINRSRKWIHSYQLEMERSKSKPDISTVDENYRFRYYRSARPGEWILNENQRWERVR